MSLVIDATNATRICQKTGSIVQRAIVISRTRHASTFMLKYRPKEMQLARRTIVVVSEQKQIETTARMWSQILRNL